MWTPLHHGPRPTSSALAALVSTPEGVVHVGKGGWAGRDIVLWRLGPEGWVGPEFTGVSSYAPPVAWHDGRLHVGVWEQGILKVWTDGGAVHEHPLPADDARMEAVWDGERVLIALVSGDVVTLGGERLATFARGTSLGAGTGRVIVVAGQEAFEAAPEAWKSLPSLPEAAVSNPAFDGERFVVIAGSAPSRPYVLGPSGWEAGEPLAHSLARGGMLAWDEGLGELVLFGGSDARFSMQSDRNDTLLVGSRRLLASGWTRIHGRRNSLLRVGEQLLAVSNTHLSALRVTATGLEPWADRIPEEHRHDFDDRSGWISGGPDALWAIDKAGRAWKNAGGAWEVAGPPSEEIALRHGGELTWDPVIRALILVGGRKRNDTWVLRAGGWEQEAPSGLPAGLAGLATTARGVYALVGAELWLHGAEGWSRCLVDTTWKRARDDSRRLLYDPRRDALLSLSGNYEGQRLRVWQPGGVRDVEALSIDESRLVRADGAAVGVDAATDRILVMDHDEVRAFALEALGDARVGLPEPAARGPKPKTRKIPKGAMRVAHRLVPGDVTVDIAALRVPEDHFFVAWLPASELLPLGSHASVALSMEEDVWSYDPHTPFSRAFAVVLLDQAPPGPVVMHRDRAVVAREVPFDDPDPSRLEEMDAGPGWDLAHHTKLGGFPNLLQGGREEQAAAGTRGKCRKCRKKLQYRVQLAADVVEVGDCGRIWIYVCPDGCDAAAVAESL